MPSTLPKFHDKNKQTYGVSLQEGTSIAKKLLKYHSVTPGFLRCQVFLASLTSMRQTSWASEIAGRNGKPTVKKKFLNHILAEFYRIFNLNPEFREIHYDSLVSGWFQPIWKICTSNWIISTNGDENKKYLKPPPSSECIIFPLGSWLTFWEWFHGT